MSIQNDELAFHEAMEKALPLLETMQGLLKSGRINVRNQQFRIDNNHLLIVDQERKIAENNKLLENANDRASKIIALAEEKAKEIEKNLQIRSAEINHWEREAKKKLEEAERVLWGAKDKKVKA